MKKIVGICACPMGVAHTYMAADAIEEAAKKLDYKVKVETQGAVNLLTPPLVIISNLYQSLQCNFPKLTIV